MRARYLHLISDYMLIGHWTKTRLSEATGINRVNLGNKLAGKTVMTVDEFITISHAIGISEVDLLKAFR